MSFCANLNSAQKRANLHKNNDFCTKTGDFRVVFVQSHSTVYLVVTGYTCNTLKKL
jgi:hypothetical protein